MRDAFSARVTEAAGLLRRQRAVLVVSHVDADGLASAAIASSMLSRAGVAARVEFVKSLDAASLATVRAIDAPLYLFTDLGSGVAEGLPPEAVICDHHVVQAPDGPGHVNPRLFGYDGSHEASGATVVYLVARAMVGPQADLGALAVIGGVGDLQDLRGGGLGGLHRIPLDDAVAGGIVEPTRDLRFFGRETRTLPKFLALADDPPIPGVHGSEEAGAAFLSALGVPVVVDGRIRRWRELDASERRSVVSGLADRLLSAGVGHASVERLVGEVYRLPREEPGTPFAEAKEFATLLNSTARYGQAEVGLALCLGDRGEARRVGLALLSDHRRNLVDALQLVAESGALQTGPLATHFHAEDRIRETVVGIVAGMLLSQPGVPRDRPIFAFAWTEEGMTKVSGRSPRDLVARGLDLSEVCRLAAAAVSGTGGGHDAAAGATIPRGREQAFLASATDVIQRQLSTASARNQQS
ncbi:MAG: DHHA1 domain-containing protein [Methanobacteriota archaeon]